MFLVILVTSSCIGGLLATLSNGKGEEGFRRSARVWKGRKVG